MSSANTVLIRNGTAVTSEGSFPADVRIEGEKIVETEPSLSGAEGDLVIDASGLLVLPGGVDPHVHLSRRPKTTRASLTPSIASRRRSRAKSLVDVFVHPVLGSATRKLEQISKLPDRGQPSLKIFLMSPTVAKDPAGLRRAVQLAAEAKVSVLFHCEAHSELSTARDALLQQGKTSLRYLPESRPVNAEVRATEQAIHLCRATGATGYIVHISCAEALALCSAARAEGLPIRTETRPEFLLLTAERHRGENAKLHVIIPPLREDADREALWRGLADRSLDLVATDDAAFWSKAEKLAAPDSFEELRMGLSGLELFRPLLFSEGVAKGRISLERFVEITATAAARIFGLYPRKGTIAVGSDADLVLWNPLETRTVSPDDLISRTGFTVYEGRNVTGWPSMTLRRGEIVYRGGEICASPGLGILVARGRADSKGK